MTQNNFTQPVILVASVDRAGKGIYISQTEEMIVSVQRKKGYQTFDFYLNDKPFGRKHVNSCKTWQELADTLGATLVEVDKKFLNKHIKFLQEEQ
jgi:hypothetical protein